MDETQPLVIDLGSGVIKAGFAGDDAPRAVFDAVVGSSRNPALMMGGVTKATYIGDEAQTKRGILSLNYPIEYGIVQDWDALEKIIHYTIFSQMRVAPEERPFLFSEHAMNLSNSLKNRLKLCQMMFENFAVPGYCTCLSSLLAGYACGTTTANVVDIGDGVMTVTPITRGYVSRRTLRRVNFSGRDLTNYMNRMLVDQGYYLNRTSDFQTVRDIKEQMCYVALDYDAEMQRSQYSTELHKQYELPDGQKLTLNSERFRCPEALFKPSLVGLETPGIHELVYDAIMSCDQDSRWVHWDNVVLSGGSTFFPGFAERLEKELQALAPEKIKVKIVAAPERKYSTWIGGSILASLAVMGQTWISKEEYDESGPYMVDRKCYNGY